MRWPARHHLVMRLAVLGLIILGPPQIASAQQSCRQCTQSFQYVCVRHYGSCMQGCARAAGAARDVCQRQCVAETQRCGQSAAANCGICGPPGWSVRSPQPPPQFPPEIRPVRPPPRNP